MDTQGFAPQGFAAPNVGGAARGAVRAPMPPRGQAAVKGNVAGVSTARGGVAEAHPSNGAKIGSLENRVIAGQERPAADERAIGVLTRIKNFGMALVMPGVVQLPFFSAPLPIPIILGPVLSLLGIKSAPGFLHMAFHAPIEALHKTSISNWHQAAANVAHAVADTAITSEGAAQRVADPARRVAGKLSGYGAAIAERPTSAAAAAGSAFGRAADSFAATSVGARIEQALGRYAAWRATRHEARHAHAVGKAHAAFTNQAPGFFRRIGNFFTGAKAAETTVAGELSGALHHLRGGNFEQSAQLLETAIREQDLSKEVMRQAKQALRHVNRAASAKTAMEELKISSGKGLRSVLGAMGKSLGRTSIFTAIVGTAVVAGTGAMMLASRKENRQAQNVLQEMEQAFGDAGHPVVRAAKKLEHGERRGRIMNTAISTVADGALMSTGGSAGAQGLAMGIQVLPMFSLHRLIFKENDILNAYATLREAEKGTMPLNSAEKQMQIRKLIGVMPEAAAHAGEYNKCVAAMAKQLVEQGAGVKEVVEVLADQKKFVALAEQARLSLAPHANTAAPAPMEAKEAVMATNNNTRAAKTTAMPHNAAAPRATINTASAANDGRLTERAVALA